MMKTKDDLSECGKSEIRKKLLLWILCLLYKPASSYKVSIAKEEKHFSCEIASLLKLKLLPHFPKKTKYIVLIVFALEFKQ